MSRFSDRLERDLQQIAEKASSSSPTTAWESIRNKIEERANEPDLEILMPSTNPEESEPGSRRHWLLIAAAGVVLVVLIGSLLGSMRNDDVSITIDPEPTTTTMTTTTTAVPETQPAQDEATAVATAEQFTAAVVALDPDGVVGMLAEDHGIVAVNLADDAESLGRMIAQFESVSTEFQSQGCEFSPPDQVRCDVLWRNAWFNAGDFPPVESTFILTVDRDEVAGVRYVFDFRNLEEPYNLFRGYLRENHPDERDVLWPSEFGEINGPALSDEARRLFELRTAEYLESLE